MNHRHGLSQLPEYKIYYTMLARCNNKNSESYHKYGARGIKVCKRWSNITNFYNDMGPRPSPKHSIERINNSKGYSPNNCRWATAREQANNRRSSRMLSYNGKKQTIAEWSRELDVKYQFLQGRLQKGWSVKRTLETKSTSNTDRMKKYCIRGHLYEKHGHLVGKRQERTCRLCVKIRNNKYVKKRKTSRPTKKN